MDDTDSAPDFGLQPRDEDERVGEERQVAQEGSQEGFALSFAKDQDVPVATSGTLASRARADSEGHGKGKD